MFDIQAPAGQFLNIQTHEGDVMIGYLDHQMDRSIQQGRAFTKRANHKDENSI
jgi:hypothetical protein